MTTEEWSLNLHAELRRMLLSLPGVEPGRRFGEEAFLFRGRFFCHFHVSNRLVYLETFVWHKMNQVLKEIPGVIRHPQYGNYGWTRLPITSMNDMRKAKRLIELSYQYVTTIRRLSLPKKSFSHEYLEAVRHELPTVSFRVKQAPKTAQILMETEWSDYKEANKVLDRASKMLRQFSRSHASGQFICQTKR